MPQISSDPVQALTGLVRRQEAKPDAVRLGIRPQDADFRSAEEADRFQAVLRAAAAAGAIRLTFGTGRDRTVIFRAAIADLGALYAFLRIRPTSEGVKTTVAPLRGRSAWLDAALEEIADCWSRGVTWAGMPLHRANDLPALVDLAQGVIDGDHIGLDYRTFSRRVGRDSKLLEANEVAVLRLVSHAMEVPPGRPREAFSQLGLGRVSTTLHVAGPFALGGNEMPPEVLYFALPQEAFDVLTLLRRPRAILTIENFVSFHRYCVEVNRDRDDLVAYTAGQPSFAFRRVLAKLAAAAGDVPAFHWGDVDEGGLEIFRTVSRVLPGLRPHLMTTELATTFGVPSGRPLINPGVHDGTAIESLGAFLASDRAATLEQEEIDPVRPS